MIMISQISSQIYYITFARLLLAFGYTMSYVYIPVYLFEVKKLSPSYVGMISGISTFLGLISWFFANYLSNLLGIRKLILISFGLRTIVFFLSGIVIYLDLSYYSLIPLLFLNSFLLGLSVSPMESYILQHTSEENRNIAFSIHRTGMNIGFSLGPLVGGFLAEYNFSYPFFGTFLLTLISIILVKHSIQKETIILRNLNFKRENINFFSNRILIYFLINSINIFIVMSLLITPLSIFLTHEYSISKYNLGKIYFLNGIMVALFQVPISLWIKNLFLSIQVGTFIYFLGFFSIGVFAQFSFDLNYIYLSVIIITLGELLSISSLQSYISILAEKTTSNMNYNSLNHFVSSYIGFIRTLGWSIGPVLSGWYQEYFQKDPMIIWFLSPLNGLLGILIFYLLIKKYKVNL